MLINYGKQDFVVDYDTDFIQRHACYLDGMYCLNCPEYDNCSEELDFVLEETRQTC